MKMSQNFTSSLICLILFTCTNTSFGQEKKTNTKKQTLEIQPPSKNTSEEDNLINLPASQPKSNEGITEFPDVEPIFQGSPSDENEWLLKNLIYPNEVIDNEINGKVYLTIIINEDGSVSSPKIIRGLSPECDKEAIRLVKSMPKWIPGKIKNKAVKVKKKIVIIFNAENQTN
jgi:TonB family protein